VPPGFVVLPVGSIHSREYLFNKGFHTNQRSAFVSFKSIPVSITFGRQDIFGPQIRLWDTDGNAKYERALQKAGYLSSSIRIFINLKKCKHYLDTHQTTLTKNLCWKDHVTDFKSDTTEYMLFVGMMYVVSYVFKNSRKFYQFAEKPAPKLWHERVFV